MDVETYDLIKYRFITFLESALISFVVAKATQWLVNACDYHPNNLWFQGLFIVFLIIFWSPWRKVNLRPRNAGNNDLFPGV